MDFLPRVPSPYVKWTPWEADDTGHTYRGEEGERIATGILDPQRKAEMEEFRKRWDQLPS